MASEAQQKRSERFRHAEKLATVHTHFNIYRDIHQAHEGEVTVAERVKAMERFVRWHERQVIVGEQMLAALKKEAAAVAPKDAEGK